MNTQALTSLAGAGRDDLLSEPTAGPVIGVRTTKIYCRASCRPGRMPHAENCVEFDDRASARAAGYRACKKCRPDGAESVGERAFEGVILSYAVGATPVGFIFIASSERGICALYLLDSDDPRTGLDRLERDFPGAEFRTEDEVAGMVPAVVAYLVEGTVSEDLRIDPHGTPFQKKVWEALREIPHGTVMSYGELALKIGLPLGAARAVGTACGANPISLLVPCHRVVRAGGGLGGYYWGLERKRQILDLERGVGKDETSQFTRPRYSPVRVSTRTVTPGSKCSGT